MIDDCRKDDIEKELNSLKNNITNVLQSYDQKSDPNHTTVPEKDELGQKAPGGLFNSINNSENLY